MRKFIGNIDTLRKRGKCSNKKTYRGHIKPTKGLSNLNDPCIKPLSHRIVRRKLQREMMKELE